MRRTRQGLVMGALATSAGCGIVDDKVYVERVIALSALNCTTCAVLADGAVWCWGSNQHGQHGKPRASTGVPVRVPDLEGVRLVDVSVGTMHVCAVAENGDVYCWGGNAAGQASPSQFQSPDCCNEASCLLKIFDNTVSPQKVGIDARVKAVSAGALHTCALTEDGDVYCWGGNHAGQSGSKAAELFFPKPDDQGYCGWTPDAILSALCANTETVVMAPTLVEALGDVDSLVVQRNTSCARMGADVKCWGNNCGAGGDDELATILGNDCSNGGQLGVDPKSLCFTDTPRSVFEQHSLVDNIGLGHVSGFASVEAARRLISWGWHNGQLGRGKPLGEFVEPSDVLQPDHASLTGVIEIGRTNGWHMFAQTEDGQTYSWGINHCAELGQPEPLPGGESASWYAVRATSIPRRATVVSGQDHACYLHDGAVYCLGHPGFVGQAVEGFDSCGGESACAHPVPEPSRVVFE